MKEFFINFTIDTAIKLAVSIYNKKGREEAIKLFKKIAYKIDISLDKSVGNKNSNDIKVLVSETLFDLSQEIKNPKLKKDNSHDE